MLEELRQENLRNFIDEDDDFVAKNLVRLKKIIEELPPRCKDILILSKQRGLDHNEIANQLDISPKTVEEQIRIAFKKIRKAFKEDGLIKRSMIYYWLIFSKR